jgi:hypothetical protein
MGDYVSLEGERRRKAYASMFGVDENGTRGSYDIQHSLGVFYENDLASLRVENSLQYGGVDFKNSNSDNFLTYRDVAIRMFREIYDNLQRR